MGMLLANKLVNLTNSAFYQLQLYFSVSIITLHGKNDSSCEKEAGYPVNSVMTNFRAKVTNSIAKATNSIAKVTNSTANGTNSVAKVTNSITKVTNSTVMLHSQGGFVFSITTPVIPSCVLAFFSDPYSPSLIHLASTTYAPSLLSK